MRPSCEIDEKNCLIIPNYRIKENCYLKKFGCIQTRKKALKFTNIEKKNCYLIKKKRNVIKPSYSSEKEYYWIKPIQSTKKKCTKAWL